MLIIGKLTDNYWQQIQFSIPAGKLNFIFSKTLSQGAAVIKTYLDLSNDTEKLKNQIEYFEQV